MSSIPSVIFSKRSGIFLLQVLALFLPLAVLVSIAAPLAAVLAVLLMVCCALVYEHSRRKAAQAELCRINRNLQCLEERSAQLQAEIARLRQNEQHLRVQSAALEAAANAIVITDTEAVIEWANPAFSALTGYSLQEALGKRPKDLVKSGLQSQAFYQAMWETIKSGQVWRGEVINKRKDGVFYNEELTITPVLDEQGCVAHFIAVKEDISLRRKLEQRQLAQFRLLEKVNSDVSLTALLEEMIRFIETQAPELRCSILLADETQEVLRHGAAPSLPDAYNRLVEGLPIAEGSGSCGTAARRGETVIVSDIRSDPLWAPYLHLLAGMDWLRACWSTPFFDSKGRLLGVFGVYAALLRKPNPYESELIAYAVSLASLVVERKRANEALGESEQKFRNIFDSARDGIVLIDADSGLIADCNLEFERQSGRALKELRQYRIWELRPAEKREATRKRYQEILARGDGGASDLELQKPGGETVPVEFRATVVAIGGKRYIQSITRDITERKRAEEALRESEEKLTLFIEHAPAALAMFDRDMRYLAASRRWMTDYNLDNGHGIIGRSHYELFPEIPERWKSVHRRGLMGEVVKSEDDRFARPNGAEQRLRWEVRPWYTTSGGVGGIVIFTEDITERKQAEERLRQAAAVFENTREGVMVTDAARHILFVNRAFTDITGYTEAEILGETPSLLRSGRHDRDFYAELWASVNATGHWQGEIWNRRKNGEVYPELLSISTVVEASGRLDGYVGVFADISKLKESEAELEFLAHHDPLTRLPNRLLLLSRLDHGIEMARREGRQVALLMLDLDRFKDINDSFGHLAGDELLQQVAERLMARLRSVDTISRLGGDEFTVLLEDLEFPEDAARVAESVIDALSQPWLLPMGYEARIGTSIGISLFPQHGSTAAELLQQADAALYQAKMEGRGRFRYFSENLTGAARERILLEARLRQAIGQNELRVFYQPQVHIATGRIVGAEALVRWQDPQHGLIPPGRFIPVAEATGLIGAVGEWVLKETCLQGKRWLEAGLPPLILAVNVSPQQFLNSDIVAVVAKVLSETGFPAARLELELTESALMAQEKAAVETLNRLRSIGVRLAIDDFGTGYSSLSYLKRFPLDVLKIDKSFVDDIPDSEDDMQIALTIVAIAHALRLQVLAEGVETEAQLAFLREHGCHCFQGYLKSPPVPADKFEKLLVLPLAEDAPINPTIF